MTRHGWKRVPLILAWLAGAGCTALKEIPRSDFASRPQRQHVRVRTEDGLVYEFDYARVADDTLTGYRERDTEGPVAEIATVAIPLGDIHVLSVRGVDWYRTALIGGGALAGLVAAGLSRAGGHSGSNVPTGGRKGEGGY